MNNLKMVYNKVITKHFPKEVSVEETEHDWKKEWEKLERGGRTGLAWMIGGADGFSENFRKSCDSVRSLGPQTLSHDLARVVLVEQIYRLESWRAGHPYHRK